MDDRTLVLIERARAADGEAVDALFDRYREPLRRALRRLIGEDYRVRIADSEDATQDAILSAFRDLESFEYQGEGSFLAWLVKRAEHALWNRVKAQNRQRRAPDGGIAALGEVEPAADERLAPDLSAGGSARQGELREVMRACLDELPEREREVILLRQFCELDTTAIAGELGLPSPAAVRNLYARAQARLAGVLASRGLGDEDL